MIRVASLSLPKYFNALKVLDGDYVLTRELIEALSAIS